MKMEKLIEKSQIMKETEKAVLLTCLSCDTYYPDIKIWLPKSQILIEGNFVIAVKSWLADKLIREHYEANIYSKEAEERFNKYLERFAKKSN